MAPCGKHGADFEGQACTICKPAPGPGLLAAAAAGAAFVWSPNATGSGETLAPRGTGREAITAGTLTVGSWTIVGGARTDAKARREVEAAIAAVEVLRRRAARHGQGPDAPKLDVVDRARAMFEPGQVPLGGAVGDLVLDMIGEIERLRGTSTPPSSRAGIRFADLQTVDQARLAEIASTPGGAPVSTTRLMVLRLIEPNAAHDGRYVLTAGGQAAIDEWREADILARQTTLVSDLTAEVARHAQALAAINTTFQEIEAQRPHRSRA